MMAGLAASAGATEVTTHAITPFTTAAPSATYAGDNAIEVKSFYNPDMGYKGWVHQSGWGYMKLTAGLPVTITAETSVAGFHPAIAVWRNAGTAPINYITSAAAMPYDQWGDVVETKGLTEKDVKVKGTIKMYFITNGVDRDGWEEPANYATASKFDQSLINRILDGTEGKVSVKFTPPADGTYKFVVGGMNPDLGLGGFVDVDVTVVFPR
jgi:hypothetical protein